MQQKEEFANILREAFENYRLDNYTGMYSSSANYLFEENEGVNFDIDATFVECVKNAGLNYVIIDVGAATSDDIETIIANWNHPTAYLFKNYGDESAGNIRNKISIFIKDRNFGIGPSDTEPQVAFCGATVTKENPIRDFSERQVFFSRVKF